MKWVIFISIFLYGCGEEVRLTNPNGLWYRHESGTEIKFIKISDAYKRAQACTGLTAPGPYVKTVGYLPESNGGSYNVDKNLVSITSEIYIQEILVHEFVHHLLYINTGDVDSCHNSELFKCSSTKIIKC